MTPDRTQPPTRPTSPGVCIGRPFGVPVYVAPSWFVVAGLMTYFVAQGLPAHYELTATTKYIAAASFVLLLYGSVLVHELSHTIVARLLGLPVRRIVLMLIGGVSELEREPKSAGSEFLVALAGPVISIALAGTGFAVAGALHHDTVTRLIVVEIAIANSLVAMFNLLPGLPLDGGRVLRAVIWRVTGNPIRGTLGAAWTGRVLGALVAVVPVGLTVALEPDHRLDPLLAVYFLVIGWFLWAGASQSLPAGPPARRLPRIQVRGLARRALTVPVDLPLAEALRRADEAGARGIVTVDSDGRPSGLAVRSGGRCDPRAAPALGVGGLAGPPAGAAARPRRRAAWSGRSRRDRQAPSSEYLVMDSGSGLVWGVLATADVARAVNSSSIDAATGTVTLAARGRPSA